MIREYIFDSIWIDLMHLLWSSTTRDYVSLFMPMNFFLRWFLNVLDTSWSVLFFSFSLLTCSLSVFTLFAITSLEARTDIALNFDSRPNKSDIPGFGLGLLPVTGWESRWPYAYIGLPVWEGFVIYMSIQWTASGILWQPLTYYRSNTYRISICEPLNKCEENDRLLKEWWRDEKCIVCNNGNHDEPPQTPKQEIARRTLYF